MINDVLIRAELLEDSDEVAQAHRYQVARGFRDDVAHLSDFDLASGEAFWPAGSPALVKPRGQSGIATPTCFSSSAVAVMGWTPLDGIDVRQLRVLNRHNEELSVNNVSTIGLDLAKHVFQAHCADAGGDVVFPQTAAS